MAMQLSLLSNLAFAQAVPTAAPTYADNFLTIPVMMSPWAQASVGLAAGALSFVLVIVFAIKVCEPSLPTVPVRCSTHTASHRNNPTPTIFLTQVMKMPYGEEQIKKNGEKEARKDKLIRIGDIVQCVMFLCSRLSGRW